MSFLNHAYQFCYSHWCNCVLIYGAKISDVAVIVVTSLHPPAADSKESILHIEIKALNFDDELYNTWLSYGFIEYLLEPLIKSLQPGLFSGFFIISYKKVVRYQ